MKGALKGRYHIEDLVGQDETGAVYCARDLETGRLVALRRFFPMGISGGGFLDREREGFVKTVEALKGVRHESLRGVLDGGVDEVDGMPYLVMEWAEGRGLADVLKSGPLAAEQAVDLAGKGLELLALLEGTFGEGSQWIEMEAATVVVTEDEALFTFWICPFQWLGVAERDGGVRGLGYLVEHAMGWGERMVPSAAAAGLGGWVTGAKEAGWTIAQALQELGKVRSFWTGEVVEDLALPELAPAVTEVPEPAVSPPVSPPVHAGWQRTNPFQSVSGAGRRSLWLAVGAAVLVLAGIGWAIMASLGGQGGKVEVRGPKPAGKELVAEPGTTKPSAGLTPQERIDRQVKRTTEAMGMAEEDDPDGDEPGEPGPRKSRLFGPEDGSAMRNWVGASVSLEGRLSEVRDSNSGKTRYLEFSDERKKNDVCCRFWARERDGMRLEDLKKLEGKMLLFMGLVQIEQGTGRVVLHLDHPGQIQVVGE
jgi:hypothetical protein